MIVSLWLLPPEPIASVLRSQIEEASRLYETPSFEPHITIVGGVDIENGTSEFLETFAFETGVECRFRNDFVSKPAWNQAYVAVLERTDDLLRLTQTARAMIGVAPEPLFPPPLGEPHLSLWYGSGTPTKAAFSCPASFYATELALWMTDPPTLEGVEGWHELGRLELV